MSEQFRRAQSDRARKRWRYGTVVIRRVRKKGVFGDEKYETLQVTIPKWAVEKLGWKDGDELQPYVNDGLLTYERKR